MRNELRHAADGWLAASCENISINVDLTTRRAAPFPADILANLSAMRDAHAALPLPEGLGDGVRMPQPRADLN